MGAVPSSFNAVQQGAIQYNNPVSESSMDSLAGPINGLLSILAPVGTVWASMLTETQFQTQIGSPSPVTWVLCDGRDVTDSEYNAVTGNTTIPDLRGIGPRGKNNGRSDGFQNPDGELALGTLTVSRNLSHNHAVEDAGHDHNFLLGALGSDHANAVPPYGSNGSTSGSYETVTAMTGITLGTSGGGDAAPTNITMNWFIRIN